MTGEVLKGSALFHICVGLHLHFTTAWHNHLSRQKPLTVKELTLHVNQTKDVHQCQQDAIVLYSVIHPLPPTQNFSSIRSTWILVLTREEKSKQGLERGAEGYSSHQIRFPFQVHCTRIQPPHQPRCQLLCERHHMKLNDSTELLDSGM